jgi:hypothetical protein
MKKLINILLMTATMTLLLFTSCKKDEDKDATNPPITNTQEQITTVILNGYNQQDPTNLSYQFSVKWEDLDGNGGNSPRIDSLLLDTGIQYHATVLLLDKTKTPWDTISNEVAEKKNIHQFFYTPSETLTGKVKITILDYDNNTPSLPVGLTFSLNTQSASGFQTPLEGSLKMVLSHYDGIPKTAAPSPESDIDIRFPVVLK